MIIVSAMFYAAMQSAKTAVSTNEYSCALLGGAALTASSDDVTAVASASHICATGGTCTFRLERKYSQLQPKQLTDSRLQSTQNAAGNASRRIKRMERRKEVEW